MSKSSPRVQILLVGIGGQGILTAATVLAEAAHAAKQPVIAGQLHGMSQRGGSVECSVIIGDASTSFIVGPPDVVVAFESLELLRCMHRLDARSRVVANTTQIMPHGVEAGSGRYPPVEEIVRRVRETGATVQIVDGARLVATLGETRTLNVLLLGSLAELGLLPLGVDQIWSTIRRRCPPRFLDANQAAFELGRAAVSKDQPRPSASVEGPAGAQA